MSGLKTLLVNLNEETYLLYNNNKYKIRALMLATKFNVKLNQLFILLMRKYFYSDQIYLIRYDSSKSGRFIGPKINYYAIQISNLALKPSSPNEAYTTLSVQYEKPCVNGSRYWIWWQYLIIENIQTDVWYHTNSKHSNS